MINFKTRARRLAAVFGCAVTLSLSVLTVAAPAGAGTVPPGTAARSQPIALFAHRPGALVAVPETPGRFRFENYAAPGECIGLAGGSPTPGTDAVLWNCNTHPDQQWSVRSTISVNGAVYQQFESNDGNLCLGVAGGSTTEGANIVGWTCLGTDHQDQWWLIGVATNGKTPCYNEFVLQNLKGNHYVIGTQGGSLAEGTDLVQWNYQNLCNNQFWNYD